MIALVWQFDVQAGRNDEFESFYGADGPWTGLSRRSRSYLGSSFMRDLAMSNRLRPCQDHHTSITQAANRYHWISRKAFELYERA